MYTLCQTPATPNTQGVNANAILTSERLNNSDVLAKTLKLLTINDAGYYESDKNDAKGNPASDPKLATLTSDGKKRKVTDANIENLQQTLLINRTLPIIATNIDTLILDRVATCGGTPRARTKPTTKGVLIDTALISVRVLWTPGCVSRTGRDGTTPVNTPHAVNSPRENGPVLIGGTTVSPTCGIMGSQDIFNKHGSTGSAEIGIPKSLTLPLMEIWPIMGIIRPFLEK